MLYLVTLLVSLYSCTTAVTINAELEPLTTGSTSVTATATSTVSSMNNGNPQVPDFDIVFAIKDRDCLNPTIDVTFEEIDFSYQIGEFFDVVDDDGSTIIRCVGDQDANCLNIETCLDDEAVGVSKIDAGTSYTITLATGTHFNPLCDGQGNPLSFNVDVTLNCDRAIDDGNNGGGNDCTTSAEYNVQIIIDESGSVNFGGIDGFGLSIDFVEELIENQLSPNAPLSVFTFGTGNNPDIETVYQFEDDQSSRIPVLAALAAVNFDSGGTPTREAIQAGIAEFEAGINGGYLNDGDRLLFILTDGVPTTGSPCFLKPQLDALEIRVIVLGVGSEWNRDNVECLADDADIHLIGGFSADNFDDLIDEISETICPPDGCVTTTEYDVQFLIDESGSVPRSGYELSIDFIQDLIINDISPDAKVSVFEFGTNVQLIYQFNDVQQPRANMIQVIENADYDSGGTRTGDAVQAGIDEWERAEAAGELSGGEKLMFILTDGRPNGGVDPCSLKDELDALGVTVIIIGVGRFDRTRVDCLAVNDGDSVIEVAAFTEEAFDAVEAAISEETCPDDEIVRPPDNAPCKEAQEYCKNVYGTNLATIITDDDRAAAQAALAATSEPFAFIGLYSDDIETKWQFRSGETCPSASAYKCVDFWRSAPGGFDNRPRCIGDGEGGYGCAVIYAADGLVDNDIPDFLSQPFLCDGA